MADEAQEPTGPPAPDPATCTGIAICQEHLEQGILDGQLDDSPYLFFLEPAGVLQARLLCPLCHPETVSAGIFMTREARAARTVYLCDDLNPDVYELAFPKEFGYVKSRQHYVPESREHAKYPWSKKY